MPEGGLPSISIIVVSRHRPQALARCLASLAGQVHAGFELVLVADPAAVGICPELPAKRLAFDQANISAARNEGLALAAGEVVLFIDDDALAEPGWAGALAAPFADPRVIAATGFTRGPDGLRWQVRAERITPSGATLPLHVAETALLAPENGCPVSTIGTNSGFRRDALLQIGGFDPAFAYYLDESDVNLRMAARFPQGLTAVVPAAQVIHGAAPGAVRGEAGVPRDLTAIGRSAAIFAARHGGDAGWLREGQRRRLLRHMVAGRLDPFAIAPILATLDRGLAQGRGQAPAPPVWNRPPPPPFQPLPRRASGGEPLFLAGWHWQARTLRARAAQAVAQGRPTELLLLTPSFLPHRRTRAAGGWWEQWGGVWGASLPRDPPVIFLSKNARILRERGNLPGRRSEISGKSPQNAKIESL
ncbi:glycosyltransferase family 2 protein [Paracoccus versutus]|uniref:GT2 family glycosyltransferase n=2 Tax=Paracoccus TaxID=265 RepID=A0A3D9XJU5_PARVE|nr:glycosyltransferase [Paracoccus versutus]REF69908.1 GT2 family glycosyltransferase [Paracoccus versutus]WGR57739.1 glycosyltransferase [Paracoccus versutus]